MRVKSLFKWQHLLETCKIQGANTKKYIYEIRPKHHENQLHAPYSNAL